MQLDGSLHVKIEELPVIYWSRQDLWVPSRFMGPVKIYAQIYLQAPAE